MIHKTSIVASLILTLLGCTGNSNNKRIESKDAKPVAPNILVIVADDMGYTDLGVLGGEINTPNLNKLAKEGILLRNFHVLPTCSPTRSALLSGADNHVSGLGSMATTLTPLQKGKPGYEGYLNDRVLSLPELLQEANYQTYISGKWHLGHEKEHSPYMNGFDESFVLLQGGGSHYADKKPLSPPQEVVYRRNGEVVNELPKDFYSTRNYTDSLLTWLEEDKSSGKPFFAYLAYTAPHDPLHAPEEYISKYDSLYQIGYEKILEERISRLKKIGFLPPNAPNPTWPRQLPFWNSLTDEEKEISAKTMAVYAAMIDYMDNQISRVLMWLKKNEKFDNTLIVFFSDNGANGLPASTYPGQTDRFMASFNNQPDNIGLANSYVATGPTWATVSMFPHKYFKAMTTEGGIKSPCIIKPPMDYEKNDAIHEFTHVSDLFPTFMDLVSVDYSEEKDPRFKTLIGQSLTPLFKGDTLNTRPAGLGYEIFGNRAYFDEEWKIVSSIPPFGDGNWELYKISVDPYERMNLASEHPEILNELISKWEAYSKNVGVVYDPIKLNLKSKK